MREGMRLKRRRWVREPAVAKRRVACSIAPALTVSKMRETQALNWPCVRQPKGEPKARSPMLTKCKG